jgi:hypothetical protein
MVSIILLVFAFVLFVLAGLGVPWTPQPWRFNLIGWGLACWVLAEILKTVPAFSIH